MCLQRWTMILKILPQLPTKHNFLSVIESLLVKSQSTFCNVNVAMLLREPTS